jgi:hypothetical protein
VGSEARLRTRLEYGCLAGSMAKSRLLDEHRATRRRRSFTMGAAAARLAAVLLAFVLAAAPALGEARHPRSDWHLRTLSRLGAEAGRCACALRAMRARRSARSSRRRRRRARRGRGARRASRVSPLTWRATGGISM